MTLTAQVEKLEAEAAEGRKAAALLGQIQKLLGPVQLTLDAQPPPKSDQLHQAIRDLAVFNSIEVTAAMGPFELLELIRQRQEDACERAVAEEQKRTQDDLFPAVCEALGVKELEDASGNESGDPLDFTRDAIVMSIERAFGHARDALDHAGKSLRATFNVLCEANVVEGGDDGNDLGDLAECIGEAVDELLKRPAPAEADLKRLDEMIADEQCQVWDFSAKDRAMLKRIRALFAPAKEPQKPTAAITVTDNLTPAIKEAVAKLDPSSGRDDHTAISFIEKARPRLVELGLGIYEQGGGVIRVVHIEKAGAPRYFRVSGDGVTRLFDYEPITDSHGRTEHIIATGDARVDALITLLTSTTSEAVPPPPTTSESGTVDGAGDPPLSSAPSARPFVISRMNTKPVKQRVYVLAFVNGKATWTPDVEKALVYPTEEHAEREKPRGSKPIPLETARGFAELMKATPAPTNEVGPFVIVRRVNGEIAWFLFGDVKENGSAGWVSTPGSNSTPTHATRAEAEALLKRITRHADDSMMKKAALAELEVVTLAEATASQEASAA